MNFILKKELKMLAFESDPTPIMDIVERSN
jgi:hypothetical protein